MSKEIGGARLGFGCAAIPGPLTRREAVTLLETAYAHGVRHFDTARMYCLGASERILGELAREAHPDIVIVTKAGIAPANRLARSLGKVGSVFTKIPAAAPRFGMFEPHQIRRSVEISLRKLKVDQVDALLLHEICRHDVTDGLILLLQALRQEGKIRAWGVATSVEETEALIAAHPELCEIVQVPAVWLDHPRPLPQGATLIVHSVLSPRLRLLENRLKADQRFARRFKEDTALKAGDTAKLGQLMLQSAMHRNRNGVTLFSTSRLDHLRENAALLGAPVDANAVKGLERALRSLEKHPEPAP